MVYISKRQSDFPISQRFYFHENETRAKNFFTILYWVSVVKCRKDLMKFDVLYVGNNAREQT